MRRFDPISFLSRLLLILVIGGAVLVLGAKFWVNYQLGRQLQQLQEALAPVGALSWREVYNTYGGRVGVRDLSLLPKPGGDFPPITMDDVGVQLSYDAVLRSAIQGPEQLPVTAKLVVTGLNLNLVDLFALSDVQSLSGNPFESIACGEVDRFIAADLEAMGFYREQRDLTVMLDRRGSDSLNATINQFSGELASATIQLGFAIPGFPQRARWPDAALRRASVALDARQFNRKRNEYCADKTGIDPANFVATHVDTLETKLAARGWRIGAQTLDQYRDFNEGQLGPWRFLAEPAEPVPVSTLLRGADAEAWIAALNLTSELATRSAQAVVVESITAVSGSSGPRVYVPDQQPSVIRRVSRWQEVRADQLTPYVDRPIRVVTDAGNEYSGYLDSVGGGRIVVATRIPGGRAQIPIPFGQLAKVEVIP